VELPRLEPLYREYRDRGFNLIALEALRDREHATAFIEENGLTYTFLETGEGDDDVVAEVFGVHSFPTSFLIDGQNRILFVHVGFEEGDEARFAEEIEKILSL
jgi:peroxiredoxin